MKKEELEKTGAKLHAISIQLRKLDWDIKQVQAILQIEYKEVIANETKSNETADIADNNLIVENSVTE